MDDQTFFLGSGGQPWGFESLHPHHLRNYSRPYGLEFFLYSIDAYYKSLEDINILMLFTLKLFL